MKNLIIASTSTLHGGDYLQYLLPELAVHFEDCKTLLFVPFARPGGISHDDYTARVAIAFNTIGIAVKAFMRLKIRLKPFKRPKGFLLGEAIRFYW